MGSYGGELIPRLSAYVTAIEDGEMVVAVEFPIPGKASTGSFIEMAERSGDFATASVGISMEYEGGAITRAAMVCSGADLVPIRAPEIEDLLTGRPLASPGAEEAGRIFAASIDPADDHIASADFRRGLIAQLTQRAIVAACTRALEKA